MHQPLLLQAGRAAGPHRPGPCEVANPLEVSWVTDRGGSNRIDHEAAEL